MPAKEPILKKLRAGFHHELLQNVIHVDKNGIPNFADSSSEVSSEIAKVLVGHLGALAVKEKPSAQSSGKLFEEAVKNFLLSCFQKTAHLSHAKWGVGRNNSIADFVQYQHLVLLTEEIKKNKIFKTALGRDYIIEPDVVVFRKPINDDEINSDIYLVDDSIALGTDLREKNNKFPILHASISCKWTIRSDRSQNARTEALNLIRNRKGRAPNIIAVTAEPLPSRIGSIALGTGDIDCVYHFALIELIESVKVANHKDALELINIMVEGKRLKDIADLPFDLSI